MGPGARSGPGKGATALPVEAVLFDVGNTLLHLDYAFLAAELAVWRNPAVTPGAVGTADALVRRRGWPPSADGDFFAGYFGAIADRLGMPAAAGGALAAAARAAHRARPRGLWDQPDPDVPAVFEVLQGAGLRLGAVSNADGRVAAQLAQAGLARWFEVVVDSALAGVAKPDPRILHLALERMGVAPERALYVGDILDVDVRGARAAGMYGVLYDRHGVWRDLPAPRCERLAEIPHLLAAGALGRAGAESESDTVV